MLTKFSFLYIAIIGMFYSLLRNTIFPTLDTHYCSDNQSNTTAQIATSAPTTPPATAQELIPPLPKKE